MIIDQDEINFNIKLECSAKFFSRKMFLVEKENQLYISSFQIINQEILEYRIFGVFLEESFKTDFINIFDQNHNNNSLELTVSSISLKNLTSGKININC